MQYEIYAVLFQN